MRSTRQIDALIELMAKLPGLGPRSARRAVLQMIRKRALVMHIGTADICDICASEARANGQICVVEDVADLWAMERGGAFKGRYHVLGGTLSVLDQVGPEQLRIPRLVDRVATEGVSEVVLALNATVDGQTTAHYIADQLEGRVAISSLAQGVPIGGELDYLDDGTITAAFIARKPV
jgi:recombination protein RecR